MNFVSINNKESTSTIRNCKNILHRDTISKPKKALSVYITTFTTTYLRVFLQVLCHVRPIFNAFIIETVRKLENIWYF